jgi:hypothetical protein
MAFPIAPNLNDTYVDPNGQEYTYDGNGWKITVGAGAVNALSLNNTTVYEPTEDYHPATKKYVDENGGGISGTTAPELSTVSVTVDEGASVNVTITNYFAELVYIVESLDESVATVTRSGNTLTITGSDVAVDSATTIRVNATAAGLATSEWTNIAVDVTYVPVVADSAVTFDLTTNELYNDGWSA